MLNKKQFLLFGQILIFFFVWHRPIFAIPVFPGAQGFGTETRAVYGKQGVNPGSKFNIFNFLDKIF